MTIQIFFLFKTLENGNKTYIGAHHYIYISVYLKKNKDEKKGSSEFCQYFIPNEIQKTFITYSKALTKL